VKKDRENGNGNGHHSHHRHSSHHLHHSRASSSQPSRSSTLETTPGEEAQVTTSAVNDQAIVAQALTNIDLKLANTKIHHEIEGDESPDSGSSASCSSDEDGEEDASTKYSDGIIRVTGHLPHFDENNMIRQRVNNHGKTRPLEPASELPGCRMDPEHIGRVHAGPVRKWLAKRSEWDSKYSSDLEKYRKIRIEDRVKAVESGFLLGQFRGENPPLCALAGWSDQELARQAGESVDEVVGKKSAASMALSMWAKVSSKPDESRAGDEKVKEVEQEIVEEKKEEREARAA